MIIDALVILMVLIGVICVNMGAYLIGDIPYLMVSGGAHLIIFGLIMDRFYAQKPVQPIN